MAVTYNMKGTSHPSFAIGKSGPRIFTSSSDPSGSETVSNSDLWIDTTDYQLKIRVSGAWKQVGETVETLSASSLAITGDLTVSGTTTSINSTVLDVNDNKITLNSDYTADPTQDAGIVINRGTATDVELRWNETTDKWQFTEDGSTYITLRDPDLVNDTTPQLGGDLDTNGNNIKFGDNDFAYFGDSSDLRIYHNGSHSIIREAGQGDLFLQSDDKVRIASVTGTEAMGIFNANGAVELYYDNSKKIETTSDGITITGTLNTHTIPSGTGTIALTSDIAAAQTLSFSNNTLSISSGNSVTIDTLPTQTDHANKFLTTDGTDASWSYVLPEAGDVWGSIASSSDENIDLGTITGDSSLWNGLDFGEIVEKISHSDLSVTTASASGGGSLSYDSSTGVFTFTPPVPGTYTVTESDVTTHQAALTITESQISDLQSYLTSVPAQTFSSLTGKPTTIAGYGITDAFDGAFSSLSGKPTTLAGYGITDAFDGAFASLSGKPTTLAGYGITDGSSDLVDDTTPQLGGDLDLNSNNITGTGDINITGDFQSDTATIASIPFSTSGSQSIIDKNGALNIRGNWIRFQKPGTNTDMIIAKPDGAVELYHSGTEVFSTTSTGATITNTSTDDALLITTTEDSSSAGPVLSLKRDSSSPANADYLGQIKFKGENSAGAEKNYAKITGKILDVTDGSEDGMIEYAFIKGGSQNISARFRGDALQLLNGTNLYVGAGGLIQFEGSSADAYETNLTVEEPTADRTVTIPDESGTVSLDAGWKKLGSANWTSDTGYVDFSVVDSTKYRQYKVVWWISHQNSTNSGNQWFITSAVFLTSGGEVSAYDNNVTWRNSSSSSETVNSTYAGNHSQMWLAGNGTTYDSHGEALFTVPNSSSFRAAMRGNSQLIGAPRQGTTAVNYLEEMASVAYNQDPTAITGIRIRGWNGTGYTSQAGNVTIFGMEM